MIGANLAKAGLKAGIKKGREVSKDISDGLDRSERYQRLKQRFKDTFTILPLGVQAFLANPTVDGLLANPENLFRKCTTTNNKWCWCSETVCAPTHR